MLITNHLKITNRKFQYPLCQRLHQLQQSIRSYTYPSTFTTVNHSALLLTILNNIASN